MALGEIHLVHNVDVVVPSHTTTNQHTLALPLLPSFKDEHEGIGKSIMVVAITDIIIITTIGIFIGIWNKCRYNSSMI